MTLIDTSTIRTDGGTQTRAGVDPATVADYAEALAHGAQFPAIIVYHDGTDYWLADGFHRLAAHKQAGIAQIEAHIRQGNRRDAVLYSVGANADHGLRRSNADKRRAVETLLLDEEWAQWSDREIARRCGVSAPLVGKVRAELAPTVNHLQSTVRRGADGREIETAHIGEAVIEPPANDWATGYWGEEFWREVNRCGLDRITILGQLQPGATRVEDLKLGREETWATLKHIATEHVRAAFPPGSYVANARGAVAVVDSVNIGYLIVKLPDTTYPGQWPIDNSGVRPATREEYDAYLVQLEEQKRQAAAKKEGRKTTLKADTIKPHAKLSWQARYAAVRKGVHADAILIVQNEQGALVLGDDVARAEAHIKRSAQRRDEAFGPVLVSHSKWNFEYDLPAAGLDIVLYTDNDLELIRYLWQFNDFNGSAPPAHQPGDLVKRKDDGRIGLVLRGRWTGVDVKLGGFKPGQTLEDYWRNDDVELHQQWQPGQPPLVPPQLPPPDPAPLPWRSKGDTVLDAEGHKITTLYFSGKPKGYEEFMAGFIAESANFRAQYANLADLADRLAKLEQYEAFIARIAYPPAGLLTPRYLADMHDEAAALLGDSFSIKPIAYNLREGSLQPITVDGTITE